MSAGQFQPYFVAYCRAHGLTPGAPFKGHESVNWISARWQEWRLLNGKSRFEPLTSADRKDFEAWLSACD